MEHIIIRTKEIPAQSSRIIDELHEYGNLEKLIQLKSAEYVISHVFQEEDPLTVLQEKAASFQGGNPDSHFSQVLLLGDSLGLSIDSHIILYSLPEETLLAEELKLFGWCYPLGHHYLGDTWWYSNEEILSDLDSMKTHEFIKKYRGIAL